MGRWPVTLTYAFAHFAVDFGCAYAMFSACRGSAEAYLLYNFCAFAMQMPLGLLADFWGRNRRFALAGAILVALVCLLPSFGVVGAMALGLGNGLFHIGGGLDVLNISGDRSDALGVFVSPGAYGIFLGTLLGSGGRSPLPIPALLLACCAMVLVCKPDRLPANPPLSLPHRRIFPWAALLFLVVALRSYGGMAASFDWKTGSWSFAAVSAVVLGKTLGGFLSERFGLFRSAAASLGLCAVLFLLSDHAVPGVLALLLFNMTMPMTLFVLAEAMPGAKGFSFGLLTFALFLGFLPTYLGAGTIGGVGMAIVTALTIILLLTGISGIRKELP